MRKHRRREKERVLQSFQAHYVKSKRRWQLRILIFFLLIVILLLLLIS